MRYTIICASNDDKVLDKNLLASSFASQTQCIIQRGYTNVQKAYNEAIPKADGEILIFVHQDVFLPETFADDLRYSLRHIEQYNWGVLGPAGQSRSGGKGWILDRGHNWGEPVELPVEVETLDELMLITRNSDIRFDESIPNHHLFGTDLCLQARQAGKSIHAIQAYCHHNSKTKQTQPEFWKAAAYVMAKWPQFLPIQTTCAELRGLDAPKILRT